MGPDLNMLQLGFALMSIMCFLFVGAVGVGILISRYKLRSFKDDDSN